MNFLIEHLNNHPFITGVLLFILFNAISYSIGWAFDITHLTRNLGDVNIGTWFFRSMNGTIAIIMVSMIVGAVIFAKMIYELT